MKILITGNLGYVGGPLVKTLTERIPEADITGFDTNFFYAQSSGVLAKRGLGVNSQVHGDIRHVDESFLCNFDAFVLLAAISNDPIGNKFSAVTYEINRDAHFRMLDTISLLNGKTVVFASSCSIYGTNASVPRSEEDEINPLTPYALTKVAVEGYMEALPPSGNLYTALRFATACGPSECLRLDLVMNDFVASALQTEKIELLSDGKSWRPLISVSDMARAVEWGLNRRSSDGGQFVTVNVGADDWNFKICDLAERVASLIPGTTVTATKDSPRDPRSYKVSFKKFRELAPDHQPKSEVDTVITELTDTLENTITNLSTSFRETEFIRLRALEKLILAGKLNQNLYWEENGASTLI